MNQYKPIPVPWKQRVRQLRVKILPLVVFLSVSMVVYFLWEERVQSPGMIGQVVAEKATVSSPARGRLDQFSVEQFDEVRAGDYIGEVVIADPERIQAQINILLGEIDVIQQSLDPVINEERNRLNIQELKVEEMQQRIELAEARLSYRQSLADFNRTEQLFERGLVSEQEYELAKVAVETNEVRVNQLEEIVNDIEESLVAIRTFGEHSTSADRDPIEASIQLQNKKIEALEQELHPRPLYAPKSGVISHVYFRSGEFVEAGSPIMEIEEKEPAYIVGYVRQPFTVQPEVGMEVEIRTRKPGRDFVMSQITRLGGHIVLIDEHLQRPGAIYESGLPVQIALSDEDVSFTPGEIVDIVMHNRRESR